MKTILLTGATDGIGLETARTLVSLGHRALVHGRNIAKLQALEREFSGAGDTMVEPYIADLSKMGDVTNLANSVLARHEKLDVLINNAGVFATKEPITADGIDVRFMVNTLAPYVLTKRLLPLFDATGRIVNLSSAAQAPVDIEALLGKKQLDDTQAYAQSKLAITMWSRTMAESLPEGPIVVAVNPGSLLGTKMVKEGYGIPGKDIRIGADLLVRAALSEEFVGQSGLYFDNDVGQFAPPHPHALDAKQTERVINAIDNAVRKLATA